MSDGYIKHTVTISGDSLLMHNGQLADPMNKYAKALKAITADRARKNTDEGRIEMARAEYEGGLYLNTQRQVILPSRVLEAHLAEGAKRTKEGQLALAAMFVDTDGILEYAGGPLTVAELLDSDEHRLTVGVTVGQAKVMRTRPLFRDWSTTFQVSVLAEMIGSETLRTWLTNGGNFKGLGDYRPRYGRYELRAFEIMSDEKPSKKKLKAVA